MWKNELRPGQSYFAGQSFSDEGALHHQVDVYRDDARRSRAGAFLAAIIPSLIMGLLWGDSNMATGQDWFYAYLPLALIVFAPIPSVLIAGHFERLADEWDKWGHAGLRRKETSPPADPPAPPPTV